MPKKEVSFVIIYHLNLTIIKQFLLILLLFISSIVEGQNLVPNGSFEEYDTCPYQLNQLHFAKPWFSPTNCTPDYFNACSTNMNVPNTPLGYKNSYTGNAMAGILIIGYNYIEYEYIGVKLTEKLKKNTTYCVSFNVSIAKGEGFYCGIEHIGLYISKDSIFQNNVSYLNFTAQINNNIAINNPDKWYEIKNEYISTGNEQFIYIGNFNATNNVLNCNYNDNGVLSYIFIDNVSIIEDTKCDLLHEIILPNVITPNTDNVNDVIDIPTEINVKTFIYNRWGNLISEYQGNKIYWDGTAKGQKCTDGVYFMIVEYELNGKRMTKQTFIQLIN